jgi:hypothetical protein
MDGGTNVTRALEAEVLAHEGARNRAVDVVSPFGHGGQKICVRPATKASRHGKKASVERGELRQSRVERVERVEQVEQWTADDLHRACWAAR